MPTQMEVSLPAGLDLNVVEERIMAAIASGVFKPSDYDILAMDLKTDRGSAKAAVYRRLYSGDPIKRTIKAIRAQRNRRPSKGWRRHIRRLKAGRK